MMRTIITNDLETKIRVTKSISLTKKGIVTDTYTSLIGDNEAKELAGLSTGDDSGIESRDPNTLIRVNGDVIYRNANGFTVTNTSEGYTVYQFPTAYVDNIFNMECDNLELSNKNVIFNISPELYFTGIYFNEINSYSEDTVVKIFFNDMYIGAILLNDLKYMEYYDLTARAPEGADASTIEAYAPIKEIYDNLNGKNYDNTQVRVKIYMSGNENVNAKGYIAFKTHTYEVDEDGNIITDSITKILEGGDATGE